jgi:hypothetical protein
MRIGVEHPITLRAMIRIVMRFIVTIPRDRAYGIQDKDRLADA